MPVNYKYDPWYLRQRPPTFFESCLPCYRGIFPARRCCLFLSVALWIIGIIVFIAVLLTCITIQCHAGLSGSLFPLAIILLWVGYLLFHCAWAAHLLEDDNVVNPNVSVDGPIARNAQQAEEAGPFQNAHEGENFAAPKQGYWQFAEREAWQAVSSRDPLR